MKAGGKHVYRLLKRRSVLGQRCFWHCSQAWGTEQVRRELREQLTINSIVS